MQIVFGRRVHTDPPGGYRSRLLRCGDQVTLNAYAALSAAPQAYLLARDTTVSANLTFVVWGPVIVLAAGLAWYVGWQAYQERRGVDIARRYAQIPVE